MALMTAAEARAYLPNIQGTAIDSELVTLIARFDAVAAQWCGFPDSPGGTVGAVQTLESASYVLYLDGPDPGDSSLLWLGVWPVTAIGSIYSDPIREYGSDTLVASSDYTLFGDQGLVELSADSGESWSKRQRAIKATVTAGFSTVPSALKHAAGIQVAHWFRSRSVIGQKSVSQRGTSTTVQNLGLLDEVKQTLAAYVLTGGSVG